MQRTSRKSAWPGRAILLLWAGTVAGFAGAAWWPLDLLSSFRPHYAFAFLAAALLLLVMRRWALAGLALAGLALNAFVVAAPMDAVQASSPPETGMERSLRLLTLNVWFRNRDLDRVVRYLAAADADVIVLQEVDAEAALALAGQLPSHPYAFVDAARVRHGAAVLSRHRIVAGEAVQLVPEGVTVAQVRVDVDGQPVTVIGAHLHWPVGPRSAALRNAELTALAALAARTDGPVLVAGDLNVTLWSPWFARLVDESGLSECAGGAAMPGSWPAWLGPAAIRIDHCLMSPHFSRLATHRGERVGSDHVPVVTDLVVTTRLARH